jgi:hypothetical protein
MEQMSQESFQRQFDMLFSINLNAVSANKMPGRLSLLLFLKLYLDLSHHTLNWILRSLCVDFERALEELRHSNIKSVYIYIYIYIYLTKLH